MSDYYSENDSLELLDALEIGFDLSDYEADFETAENSIVE